MLPFLSVLPFSKLTAQRLAPHIAVVVIDLAFENSSSRIPVPSVP